MCEISLRLHYNVITIVTIFNFFDSLPPPFRSKFDCQIKYNPSPFCPSFVTSLQLCPLCKWLLRCRDRIFVITYKLRLCEIQHLNAMDLHDRHLIRIPGKISNILQLFADLLSRFKRMTGDLERTHSGVTHVLKNYLTIIIAALSASVVNFC